MQPKFHVSCSTTRDDQRKALLARWKPRAALLLLSHGAE
jgi:hypothetical protein